LIKIIILTFNIAGGLSLARKKKKKPEILPPEREWPHLEERPEKEVPFDLDAFKRGYW
jgi:hypothetical protein